jgi:hypothetical protein
VAEDVPPDTMEDLKILQKTAELHEARWWEPEPNNKAHCYLCPRHCHIVLYA